MLEKLLVIEEKYNEIMDALMKPEVLRKATCLVSSISALVGMQPR